MKQLSQNMGIKDCEIIIISQTYYVIFIKEAFIDHLLCTWIFIMIRKMEQKINYTDVLPR